MTAAELLNSFQITVEQARAWIMSQLENPKTIFDTALSFGINSDMLAEIVAPVVPGVTADLVESFFSANGLNGNLLRAPTESPSSEIFPDDFAALASLVTFNTNTGILSTEQLRAMVITEPVTQAQYDQAFNPLAYSGADDGQITGTEFGLSTFPTFEATAANLESLYYGTSIKAFKSIDLSEILEISNFTQQNQAGLESGDATTMASYIALMVSVFEDPAAQPLLTDQQLAESIVNGTKAFVELVGTGDTLALFDGLLTGFLPA